MELGNGYALTLPNNGSDSKHGYTPSWPGVPTLPTPRMTALKRPLAHGSHVMLVAEKLLLENIGAVKGNSRL